MPIQMKMSFPLDRHPPTEAWEEAFVYLDEQHPSLDDESFAIGFLVTPARLPQVMIDLALGSLPQTSSAVARGYFHAVDDRRRAQTALADAIGMHMNAAEFRAFRWIPSREPSPNLPQNERHMHTASLVLDRACSIVRTAIHVEYAAGPTISLEQFRKWMKEHEDVRLRSMIRYGGSIPMRFPNIVVNESTPAASPGIQAVDLLLWHQRRLRSGLKPRCEKLFERSHLQEDMQWTQEDGPMENWVFSRNSPTSIARRPGGRVNEDWNHWANLLIGIERVVHRVARLQSPPAHVLHLMPRVRAASASLRGHATAGENQQQEFLRVFLLLADTLPIYNDDFEVQQLASDAIHVATTMADFRFPECISRLDHWADIRRMNPKELGWDE